MENGTGNSLRLLVAALLMFGGLAAILIGIVMAMPPADEPECDAGMPCIAATAVAPVAPAAPVAPVAPVADGLHHSDTD